MSVDPIEIAKFDSLASVWWDPAGPMKPLHQLNPLRLQVIQKQLSLPNLQVLDIGCGGGLLSEAMAQCHAQVTAIDLSEPLLAVADQHAREKNLAINYRLISSAALATEQPHHYDAVTCMELLEHVPDPEQLIADCACLVKPQGMVFFATLNRNLESFFKAIIGAEYLLKMLPKGTHHYDQLIRPSELILWATRAGLSFKGLQGFSYSLLLDKFSLSTDVSVNYMAFFQRQSEEAPSYPGECNDKPEFN